MSDPVDVLVIGAGVAGLACARALAAAGVAVRVVDKGRGVGGRMATRRLGGHGFDTGAQFFTARTPAFAAEVQRWHAAGACAPWSDGLLGGDGRLHRDGHQRWRGCGAMTAIPKQLAQGLAVDTGVEIDRLDAVDGRWLALAGDGRSFSARRLVLTAPVPQALRLLDRGRQPRALPPAELQRLRAVRYRTCLGLLLEWPEAAEAALPAPGGLRCDDEAEPVQWLLSHRRTGQRPTGEGLTMHLRGAWCDPRYDLDDAALLAEVAPLAAAALARWCGPGWRLPAAPMLKRWRYAHALNPVPEACWPCDLGAPLVLAGDAFGDAPRIEGAWCSGMAAAAALAPGAAAASMS